MGGTLVAGLLVTVVLAQTPPPRPSARAPLPAGQRITAADGDLVVAENGARVRFIRRTQANVRAIYNNAEHWLLLLVDVASPDGKPPDGGVDTTYTFNDVAGDWPLGERWEGNATLEEYSVVGEGNMTQGTGLVTGSGLVQLLGRMNADAFRDASAAATLTYTGSGRGGAGNMPFAAVEAQQIVSARRNAQGRMQAPGGFSTSVEMAIEPGTSTSVRPTQAAGDAPVRVGGNIATPRRIVDAKPVTPPEAEQANVRGVVILEIVVGPDGAVRDVKVIRGIPLLTQAAIDTAKQWRYEPTLLNGRPVPVIMTVTVYFQ